MQEGIFFDAAAALTQCHECLRSGRLGVHERAGPSPHRSVCKGERI